nr:MAG TPA: hypothetical protein [Caudoviricetes sp.]
MNPLHFRLSFKIIKNIKNTTIKIGKYFIFSSDMI